MQNTTLKFEKAPAPQFEEMESSTFDTSPTIDGADETSVTVIVGSINPEVPDDELRDMLAQLYPATRCTHHYDCCGSWYADPVQILGRTGPIVVLSVYSRKNI